MNSAQVIYRPAASGATVRSVCVVLLCTVCQFMRIEHTARHLSDTDFSALTQKHLEDFSSV